jgi:hypothetical protein
MLTKDIRFMLTFFENRNLKKNAACLLFFGLLCSAAFCAVLFFHCSRLVPVDISSCGDEDCAISYGIFGCEENGDKLFIWAYAVPVGEEGVKQFECHILLNPVGTDKYYKAFTMCKDNCEVQRYASGCANYKYTGFLCCLDSDRINKGTDYRICILYKNDGKSLLLHTDEILTGGEQHG